MRKTTESTLSTEEMLLVNTEKLQALLSCGRRNAVRIGTDAKAVFRVGRRVFWNVQKIRDYLEDGSN